MVAKINKLGHLSKPIICDLNVNVYFLKLYPLKNYEYYLY